MANLDKLKKLIAASYGVADNKFGGHPLDSIKATEAICEANGCDVGMEEYLELHVDYLKRKGVDAGSISEELEKVKDISRYFKHD